MPDERKLVLGTAQFGFEYGKFAREEAQNEKEIQKIINLCRLNGVTQIDTAPVYGDFFSKNLNVHDFYIDTKIFFPNLSDIRSSFSLAIESTLSSLSLEKINTLYLHNPSLLNGNPEATEKVALMFNEAKSSNLISNVGISTYSVWEIEALIKTLEVDIVQMPINYIDGYFRRDYENLKALKEKRNFLIYARSVFLQGILINLKQIPKSMLKHKKFLNQVEIWLDKNNTDPISACISFVERCDIIDKYIIGVQNSMEFQQIIDTVKLDIPISEYPFSENKELLDPRRW